LNIKVKNMFNYIRTHYYIFILALPFLLMDILIRTINSSVDFYPAFYGGPNIFTISWIALFIGIILSMKGIWRKVAYWILFTLFFVFFIVHSVYYSFSGFFFNFNMLRMASEGSSYILDVVINANPILYIIAVAILVLTFFVVKMMPAANNFSYKTLLVGFAIFLALHIIAPLTLGKAYDDLMWKSFRNARNVYNNFSDYNKSMKVSGLYEYTFRNFYITFLKPEEKISDEDSAFLESCYGTPDIHPENDYTGIFEGKNLIFLQLEGIDDWLLTEETMPNLYGLMQNSINFADHYSTYTGGGSTFNSEFSVITGFTTPISYIENVYTLNENSFDNSMANLFKAQNYSVNAFHMNSGSFYSRDINYKSWGFDNYYGLADITTYTDNSYELDRELINNDTFYDLMFKGSEPFVHYIITYTPHTPFSTDKDAGKALADVIYGNNVPKMDEEAVAKMMAGETDYMIGLLIQALKDNNLYDNTVIVAYADHYLYTINDKSVLDKYKTTENNLINHTPFFIWSSDVTPNKVNKVTAQGNILPTVLNLFGIEFDQNKYLLKDALAPDYEGLVFFSDYSWYDGNVYVENGVVTNGGTIDNASLEEKSSLVNTIIKKNDLTLKYNYLK